MVFQHMIDLAEENDAFRDLLLEALRSPPVGQDTKEDAIPESSNLDIDSVEFAVSDKLPIDSARYFMSHDCRVMNPVSISFLPLVTRSALTL